MRFYVRQLRLVNHFSEIWGVAVSDEQWTVKSKDERQVKSDE